MFIVVLGIMWFIWLHCQEVEGQLTEEQISKKNEAEAGVQLFLLVAFGLAFIWVSLGW